MLLLKRQMSWWQPIKGFVIERRLPHILSFHQSTAARNRRGAQTCALTTDVRPDLIRIELSPLTKIVSQAGILIKMFSKLHIIGG